MKSKFVKHMLLKKQGPLYLIAAGLVVWAVVALAFVYSQHRLNSANPLAGKTFYVDNSRTVSKTARDYNAQGKTDDAMLLQKISSQPGVTWLTGPSADDPDANEDVAEVARTSSEAAKAGTTPVYELYAIPHRDACAGYSKAGFATNDEYLNWLNRILEALKTKAVFSIEADAVAQTVGDSCLSPEQIGQRYDLLKSALQTLSQNRNVLASYLDAGHSEWLPDPTVLVGPLKKSGVDMARGVAVNVSYSVAIPDITKWAQELVQKLGGNKGVIIDTSRNGQGSPPPDVKGEDRWCNAKGRGLGPVPTSKVSADNIDAYLWIKIIGESDGNCRGHKPAGTFETSAALELAKNAEE